MAEAMQPLSRPYASSVMQSGAPHLPPRRTRRYRAGMARPPSQPTLRTARLVLRPFAIADAPVVKALAGAREIASTTLNVPHPYDDGMAETWIGTHAPGYDAGEQATFAVMLQEDGDLVGAIGLTIVADHDRAELGYWVGVPYWNRGYASEATVELLRFGFEALELNRIYAVHLVRNPASGRVMQKAGMRYEGTLRQHVRKWDVFEDLAWYGLLAVDWRGDRG
jgi:[ribosomal protein S5]-alanine N-acetyltransferase